MSTYPMLLVAALVFACGNTVDVGQDNFEHWSDAPEADADPMVPQTVFHGRVRVVTFTVDDSYLFALIEDGWQEQIRLVSCPTDRCQSQRTTLFSAFKSHLDGAAVPSRLVLAQGVLYWLTGNGSPASGIASCPTDGCPEGPELLVQSDGIVDFACDGAFIYWLDQGSLSVMRRAVEQSGSVEAVYRHVFDGAVPWPDRITEYGAYLYLSDKDRIFRVRKDGTGEPESIAQELNIGDVRASEGGVYFATHSLLGSLFRCPLDGCFGAQEELARAQRWPVAIHVDASAAFWLNAPTTLDGQVQTALVTCALPHCTDTRTLAAGSSFELEVPLGTSLLTSVFAVNRSSVFWQEGDDWNDHWLRRLPR